MRPLPASLFTIRAHCVLRAAVFAFAAAAAGIAIADDSAATTCPIAVTPYTATYHGSYKGWRIDTTQELEKRPSGQWRLSIRADNFLGSILEKSYFTVAPDGKIHSEEYDYQKKVLMNRGEVQIVFDWPQHRAVITGGKVSSAPLKDGEFDDVNYQLALRCDLLAGKTDMHYPVVDGNGADTLDFQVAGEEELDTTHGKLQTIVVKRLRANNNRSTTLWFAKGGNYAMVKLLQEEKKDAEAYLLYLDDMHPSAR